MPSCYMNSYNAQLKGDMHNNCPFEEMYTTDWNQQVAGFSELTLRAI